MEWSDDCPSRGPALGHAHWNKCKPPAGHPYDPTTEYAGRPHRYDQCCHCEASIVESGHPDVGPTPASPGSLDHPYIPTIRGLCARANCSQPQIAHPSAQTHAKAEVQAEEFGLPVVCPVNHESILPKHLIGDGGVVWTSCPQCGVMLEPKLATGKVDGRRWGFGRGEFALRDQQRALGQVGWRAWLVEHFGGIEHPSDPA